MNDMGFVCTTLTLPLAHTVGKENRGLLGEKGSYGALGEWCLVLVQIGVSEGVPRTLRAWWASTRGLEPS